MFYFPGLIYAFIVIQNSKTTGGERRYLALKRGKSAVPMNDDPDPVETFMKT